MYALSNNLIVSKFYLLVTFINAYIYFLFYIFYKAYCKFPSNLNETLFFII